MPYSDALCKQLYEADRAAVSKKRLRHILGVADCAEALAKRYGVDAYRARVAGLLHDWMRETPGPELLQWAAHYGIAIDQACQAHPDLLHGPVAAARGREVFGIADEGILNAVRAHTLGAPQMDALACILYLSDAIERTRDYPGVDALRALAQKDLLRATIACMEQSIAHLKTKDLPVHPVTICALRALQEKIQNEEAEGFDTTRTGYCPTDCNDIER